MSLPILTIEQEQEAHNAFFKDLPEPTPQNRVTAEDLERVERMLAEIKEHVAVL